MDILGVLSGGVKGALTPENNGVLQGSSKPVFTDESPIPFYPSSRYVDANKPLAPEKSLTYGDIKALAEARKIAEKNGVLTPQLGEHLLPMAMVEGRSGNFGIKQDNAFYAKPSTLQRFKNMGLSITDITDPKVAEQYKWDSAESSRLPNGEMSGLQTFRHGPTIQGPIGPFQVRTKVDVPAYGDMLLTKDPKLGKILMASGQAENFSPVYAKIMAAILSEKAANDPTQTLEGAIKLYNGKGRALETSDGVTQQADVEQYLKKVQAAKEMLAHPKNQEIVRYFNTHYQK